MGGGFGAIAARRLARMLLMGCVAATGCLPTPVLRGMPVSGRVVDAQTGAPLAGALVVVRWDARRDERLPDRDVLGHVEVRTDATGGFRTEPLWKPGLALWPLVTTEARVVGVMREDYRCPSPIAVAGGESVRVDLIRATDLSDRRASCRPIAARASETPRYLDAWRALHPSGLTPA